MTSGVPTVFRKGEGEAKEPLNVDRSVPPVFRSGAGEEKEARDLSNEPLPATFRKGGGEPKEYKFPIAQGSLPTIFRGGSEKNYSLSWYDMATGVGYKNFYGVQQIAGTSSSYALLPDTMESYWRYTSWTNTAGELNFDLLFSVNTILGGKCFVDMPIYFYNYSGTGRTFTPLVNMKIYKVSSGAETQLGTTASQALNVGSISNGDYGYWNFASEATIPNPTLIRAGESIRVEATLGASGFSNTDAGIYHDPKNHGTTAIILSNQFVVALPLRVER